jgi:hypothetical protein
MLPIEKGTPAARPVRNATGLSETAGLPTTSPPADAGAFIPEYAR